ncbi:MAG: hypothetical protein ABIE74_07125 [Pseudomonadota bacterium]
MSIPKLGMLAPKFQIRDLPTLRQQKRIPGTEIVNGKKIAMPIFRAINILVKPKIANPKEAERVPRDPKPRAPRPVRNMKGYDKNHKAPTKSKTA